MRQYIGARYVPRFTGLYDATQAYEALDVVDNGSGTSYIAKKPTPPNTPLTDTDYWFLYGSTNGAIINLQNQIGDISDLSTRDTADLVSAINSIVTRKFVFLEDSYGTFHDNDNLNFVQLGCAMAGLVEGTDYFQFSQSGAGFCSEAPHQFLTVLQNNEASIDDRSTITDIVVFGSANDQLGTYNSIRSGISSFWNYVKVNYPNAKIHIACLSKSIEEKTYIDVLPDVYRAYQDAVDYKIDYIENCEFIMSWLNLYRSDATHPTTAAITDIARYVASWLIEGKVNVHRKLVGNGLFDFTNSDLLTLRNMTQPTMVMSQDNGSVNARCGSSGILFFCQTTSAKTFANGTTVIAHIADCVDSLFYPEGNNATTWYGSMWHGNDRYGCILTFNTDDIRTNNKMIKCQLIVENTTGASVTINSGENISLIFPDAMNVVM